MKSIQCYVEKKNVPFDEQETTITIDYSDKAAYVYSCYPPMMKQLYKIVHKYPSDSKIIMEDDYGIQISVPIKWIGFKFPRKISELTKKKRSEQMSNLNKNMKGD